jgi:hypothetical protein
LGAIIDIQVTITIEDAAVDDLAEIIGSSAANFSIDFEGHVQAAAAEYIAMYQGDEVPAGIADARQLRLALLAQKAYAGGLPDEERVAALFRLTIPNSRTLIRNTVTKYPKQISASAAAAAKTVLQAASWDGENVELAVSSPSLVEVFNRRLANDRGDHVRVSKKQGTVSIYVTAAASYALLCAKYGAAAIAKP